jgi:hypothetical protein
MPARTPRRARWNSPPTPRRWSSGCAPPASGRCRRTAIRASTRCSTTRSAGPRSAAIRSRSTARSAAATSPATAASTCRRAMAWWTSTTGRSPASAGGYRWPSTTRAPRTAARASGCSRAR